jgi:hypothetical protein
MKFSDLLENDNENKELNKPFRLPTGSKKKFGVYVKNDKGNIVKVTFGDPLMSIKRDDDDRLKAFRSRHSCDDDKGPKWKARWWSCEMWRKDKSVTDILGEIKMQFKDIINEDTNLLKKIEQMMKDFDSYYEMSDDHRYWVKGTEQKRELEKLKDELVKKGLSKDLNTIYQKYKKHLITGEGRPPIFGDKI